MLSALSPTNSHILFSAFEYAEPQTLEAALALLARLGSGAQVMAGGTDLLVQMKMERRHPTAIVSLTRIRELDGIAVDGEGVHIGATTGIRSIYKADAIRRDYAALAQACNWFSTVQIMAMGTLGGNLCNASPAADTAPPLLAFGASVTLASAAGTRTLPLDEFFSGPGQTALRPGEILTQVHLPTRPRRAGSAFVKIARVGADISKACVAVSLARDGNRVADCKIALGSVAPTPVRVHRAEAALTGQPFDPELVEQVAQQASDEIRPITDVRSTREYRRHVTAVMVADALAQAWERADENGREAA